MVGSVTRRTFLASTAAAAAYGFGGVMPAFADVNWKKYAGTKIGVNLIKSPRGEVLQKYEKEFIDLTGIQVSSEREARASTWFISAITCRSASSRRPIGWPTSAAS
jgi:hypothetical protein